jgi:hypothetical protein
MEVSGQLDARATSPLPPSEREPTAPIIYEAGWAQETVAKLWRRQTCFAESEARRYTDWAI